MVALLIKITNCYKFLATGNYWQKTKLQGKQNHQLEKI